MTMATCRLYTAYVDNSGWASDLYGVDGTNIWEAKTPYCSATVYD